MPFFKQKIHKIARARQGFGLVEIVVAVSIITLSFFAASQAVRSSSALLRQSMTSEKAALLTEEGMEVVRLLRDISWSTNILPLVPGTTYYPTLSGSAWSLSTTNPGAIDGVFTRTVAVEDVYRRNTDDDIVDPSFAGPKTIDPGTQKITVRVSWGGGQFSKQLITYISDIFGN